jgi:hypothetical protein
MGVDIGGCLEGAETCIWHDSESSGLLHLKYALKNRFDLVDSNLMHRRWAG